MVSLKLAKSLMADVSAHVTFPPWTTNMRVLIVHVCCDCACCCCCWLVLGVLLVMLVDLMKMLGSSCEFLAFVVLELSWLSVWLRRCLGVDVIAVAVVDVDVVLTVTSFWVGSDSLLSLVLNAWSFVLFWVLLLAFGNAGDDGVESMWNETSVSFGTLTFFSKFELTDVSDSVSSWNKNKI